MSRRTLALTVSALAAIWMPQLDAQAPNKILKVVGETHMLALRADGSVVGWGQYRHGQLGPIAAITGTSLFKATHLVPIPLPRKAIDVAAGGRSSLALLDDGSVMAWGEADSGQLGIGNIKAPLLSTSTPSMQYRGVEQPTRVSGLADVAHIAAGGLAGYAVLRDGTVRSWGRGAIGDDRAPKSLSGPSTDKGPAFAPVIVPGLTNVVAISAAAGHVLALTSDGRVFSWGSNAAGELGRPPRQELALDTAVEIPGLADVVQVGTGIGVSTALKKDGTVWVWGSNSNNQFGFGERTSVPGPNGGWVIEPQQVPGLATVTSIAVGGRHTLALLKDGTIRAWGNNDWGQVGSGLGAGFQARPIAPKINGVEIIHTAGGNSFATRRDGSFWAWGAGDRGEFPLAANVRVPGPIEVK